MNISTKTILITGANRGIVGRFWMKRFARERRVYAGTRGALTIADERVTR
jgi:NAD(P)-dependent dehydrogenase (short-subunit alcohol dehydrogenase family)